MSPVLAKLFEKAAFKRFPTTIDSIHPNELALFAELIVRECATIVNENDFEGSHLGNSLLFEHFEIEE